MAFLFPVCFEKLKGALFIYVYLFDYLNGQNTYKRTHIFMLFTYSCDYAKKLFSKLKKPLIKR